MKVALILLSVLMTAALAEPEDACAQEINCMRPDCVCATVKPPLDPLPTFLAPQFVVVSFNDAVRTSNFDFYNEILNTYLNPNGCRMTMTMFTTHLNNDYTLTNELYRLGCEIGVRSVSASPISYWNAANYSTWSSEFTDAKKMIAKYARIPEEEIIGSRAALMQIGGDIMYSALNDGGFQYDSSWTALDYTNWYGDTPLGALFPYTLDFQSPQIPDDCPVGVCPENLYPGLFVTPVLDLQSVSGTPCNMIDACQNPANETDCPDKYCEDKVFNFLKGNFDNNYNGNRAPFGLHTAPSWFLADVINNSTAHRNGYKRFLDYVAALEDVWIVSHNRMLEWMKNPVSAAEVEEMAAFQCVYPDPPSICPTHENCNYDGIPMNICTRPCPENYPWLGNVDGN